MITPERAAILENWIVSAPTTQILEFMVSTLRAIQNKGDEDHAEACKAEIRILNATIAQLNRLPKYKQERA